jgi:hypothetical protein
MVSEKNAFDIFAMRVQNVNDKVSIDIRGCCKNENFIIFAYDFEELHTIGSDIKAKL